MKVLIAGDFAPVARLAKQIEGRCFSEVFSKELCGIIQSADFSFVNFESPIIENGYKPIAKCGPNLHCTPEAAAAVKYAGFTGVTLANNHIFDFGVDGLHKTVECCKSQGLDIVGVGDNLKEAGKILYLEREGKVLAVINCCEHEFSIATETEAGANPLNPIRQFYAIQDARKKADYIFVIVHGGHEHYQLPSPRMQETYRFFIDAGADAVINHHQHCYSGYEEYNGKPIFYGLGNFCFDTFPAEINSTWNYGYMLELTLEKDIIRYKLLPYCQYSKNSNVELIHDKRDFGIQIERLNGIIANTEKLRKCTNDYYSSTSDYLLNTYQPYGNRVLNKLFRMHLLPSLVSLKKFVMLYNYINCESHRDKQLFALKNKFDK